MLSRVDDAVAAPGDDRREASPPDKLDKDPGSQNTAPASQVTAAEPRSVSAGARDDHAASQSAEGTGAPKWILGAGAALGVLWLFYLAFSASSVDPSAGGPTPSPATAANGSTSPGLGEPVQRGGFDPSHAIAAINANVRSDPFPKAKVVRVVSRGENVQVLDETETFLRVRLGDNTDGWLAKELAIPVMDGQRLQRLSAQQYLEQRASEGRLESLVRQREPQMKIFLVALFQIANRSPETLATLNELENAKAYALVPDEPAAVWYGLSAKAATAVGNFEEAAWNSRAAIEADPANPDYHIALALSSFEAGNYEVTKAVAKMVPFLAPRTTNAWVVLGLAEALDEKDGLDSTATGAFVLAVRLSRNPAFTRKYLSDLSTKSTLSRVRRLTALAMAEEKADPSVFVSP
jgi:hypothetical protein